MQLIHTHAGLFHRVAVADGDVVFIEQYNGRIAANYTIIRILTSMREKVYIDSTIPSYYFDERSSLQSFQVITKRWWDEESQRYELWTSNAVLQELRQGNYPNKNRIAALIKDIPSLDFEIELEDIAWFYIENFVMPKTLIGDAIHLAYSSYYNIDYLLTWNCNHLANANKKRHIRIINNRLGLETPEIITPMLLFKEVEND
jgi:predicted nucleic acid-binding protein